MIDPSHASLWIAQAAAQSAGWEEFAGRAAAAVIQAAISGLIVGLIAWGTLKATVKGLKDRQEEQGRSINLLADKLDRAREERSNCEVRAAREFASKAELNGVFSRINHLGETMQHSVSAMQATIHEDIAKVHGRVTEVQTALAKFQGDEGR